MTPRAWWIVAVLGGILAALLAHERPCARHHCPACRTCWGRA